MKLPLKHPMKAHRPRPARIEVNFGKQELNHRIRLIVNAACAARGGIARMTLSDWCDVEAEVTHTFPNGLRVRRRCTSVARTMPGTVRDLSRHFGPGPTRE